MIKNIWEGLTAQQQRMAMLSGIIIFVVAVSSIGYVFSRSPDSEKKPTIKQRSIPLDKNLLERSALTESRREDSKQNETLEAIQKELMALKEEKDNKNESNQKNDRNNINLPPIPPPPVITTEFNRVAPPLSLPEEEPAQQSSPQWRGGIVVVSNTSQPSSDSDVVKKKGRTIYLPPSFMEAILLSGLDAKTVESGRSDPAPVLLRITNMAILPNDIKSHLRGCFVIAHGFGHLDDERVALRLVSLSCVTKKGHAVIDQTVKGFVVDSDGKIGLRGTVVTKMGSMLARSFLSGFFGGVGDALKTSSQTSSVSPLGVTKEVKSDDLAKAGVGAGLSQSAGELQRFYLDLARQTMPIIEVGATKKVTIVISEGVELKIENYCMEESECEKRDLLKSSS
jgi:conjugal transfer pilus assembly protein TraB